LGNPIFNGTTHMMMLGTNNLEVADVILNWVGESLSKTKTRQTASAKVTKATSGTKGTK